MAVVSICPKCNKEGTQSITYKPSKENPKWEYLTFIHSNGERHFIGRIRTEAEFIGEMNKPETKEEYERAMVEISKDLRKLAEYYSKSKSGSAVKLARSIQDILANYGF